MRLFAVDMDGTCLNKKHLIPKTTLDALRRAADAGIEIVPTTGRALSCLPQQLRAEPYIRYVISSNGAVVSDTQEGTTLHRKMIPSNTAVEILDTCNLSGIGLTIHADGYSYVEGRVLAAFGVLSYGPDASHTRVVPSIADILKSEELAAEEIQLFFFSSDAKERVLSALKGFPSICTAATSRYVEVFSENASKGKALRKLADHLGIRPEHIACVGDAENDLSMFQVAGMSFAVANALPRIQKAADHVVASNNKNGVAEAITKYLL